MQRKPLAAIMTLALLIIVAFTFLTLHTLGLIGTGARMDFKTISKGVWSGHTSQAYYAIQDAEEWTRVWNQHQQIFIPPTPPPTIDFSNATVIAVFMGECRTTGYSIEVKEIIGTGLTVIVKVEKVYPGKGCVVGMALTHPYHIVQTNKINKHVIFETSEITVNCG